MNNEGKLNEKLNDMKRFLVLILAIIPVCGMMAQSSQESKMNKFVDNLMKKMTIEEKIGQLNMLLSKPVLMVFAGHSVRW